MKLYKTQMDSIFTNRPTLTNKNIESIFFPKPFNPEYIIYRQQQGQRQRALFDILDEIKSTLFPQKAPDKNAAKETSGSNLLLQDSAPQNLASKNSTIENLASVSSSIKPNLQDGSTNTGLTANTELAAISHSKHMCFGRTTSCGVTH